MILAALLLSAAATPEAPRAGYKNADLGMTLAAFKALPFPGKYGQGETGAIICTDLRDWDDLPSPMYLAPWEKALGIVKCSYYTDRVIKGGGLLFGNSTITFRSRIPIGEDHAMVPVEYSFYQGRLFKIAGVATLAAADDIADGLTARFGEPTTLQDETVQNRMGATFPKKVARWDVGPDMIELEAPGGGKIDTAAVIFLEKSSSAAVQAERDRRDPAASKM